jgi:hypothetical protein
MRGHLSLEAGLEVTRRAPLVAEAPEEDDAAETEVEITFRRKLAGIRFLPRHQRAQALRSLIDWRRLALKVLREKRAGDRRARQALRQMQRPDPGQWRMPSL